MPNGVNKVGGKKAHRPRTQASRDAHNVARPRVKRKEQVIKVDETRTTFGKQLDRDNGRVMPKSAVILQKGRYEQIPGTRIQNLKGGAPVRVVTESGKQFAPDSVWSCKQYLLKVSKEKREAAEIARMRGEPAGQAEEIGQELPDEITGKPAEQAGEEKAGEEPPEKAVEEPLSTKAKRRKRVSLAEERRAAKKRRREGEVVGRANSLTKKERKLQQRGVNQQKLVELRSQHLGTGERVHLGNTRYNAEVVSRAKGFAWIRLLPSTAEPVPEEVAKNIKEQGGAGDPKLDADGLAVALWFFDVAEQGLNLQPGASLSACLCKDPRGIVACEARAIGSVASLFDLVEQASGAAIAEASGAAVAEAPPATS